MIKNICLAAAAFMLAFFPADARRTPKTAPAPVVKPEVSPCIIPVETDGTQLLLAADREGTLRIVHYGAKVADPDSFLGYRFGMGNRYGEGPMAYPTAGGLEHGQTALHVKYADGTHNTELCYVSHGKKLDGNVCETSVRLKDYVTNLEVKLIYTAYLKEDVIQARAEILNGGKSALELLEYASSCLDLLSDKYLLTHFHGDWAYEMQVDRELLTHDTKVIESRRGVQTTSHKNPSFLLSLSTSEFREDEGEVVAGALEWSGNFRLSFQQDESGHLRVLSGISPYASAWKLKAGESFVTPAMLYTWSDKGGGGASRNLHRWARNYGVYGGAKIKPTLLNSWEGAYFSFTTETLLRMIDDAAAMGLEMFVLDDGWFGNEFPRDNDRAGLGDWDLNRSKIPEGIDYLASYAHSKGLKFGIWIEPEMVNPASVLAREHPEWIVKAPGRENYQIRNQWILDLSNPKVQDFVFGVFDRTMSQSPSIDYVKWDCNRSVASFGSDFLGADQDRFYVSYIQGLYKVMERVRQKYPDTLIQCCSGGGSRVDYGSLAWCDEFWTSDNTDAVSRIRIQYGSSLIYPACVMASHVSAVPNHQTGDVTSLKFRFDMACAGRLGMELQPRNMSADERAFAARCIESYKQFRDLVYTGDLYRLASPYDGDYYALMYVSEDRSRAVVFTYCLRYRNRSQATHTFRLKGLDPDRLYKVTELNADAPCWRGDGQCFSGSFLEGGGFNPELLKPRSSAVFLLEAR
ncbi:MAG: alpha-galactosidase [Bacteroidales bacterium]|nr:alpha-galactosidase [Bacteroidales bacterium]